MSTNKQVYLLRDLQSLLEKQKEMVRRSDFHGFEVLTEQAGSIVNEIAKTKVLEQTEFNGQRERLAKLYKELALMVTAQKERVGKQLQMISEGKRALEAYRDNS